MNVKFLLDDDLDLAYHHLVEQAGRKMRSTYQLSPKFSYEEALFEEQQTWEERIRATLFRQVFVLPNRLGIVFRGSHFSRFLHPGRPNRRPKIGREIFKGFLNLDTVFRPFHLKKVMSQDGYAFSVKLTLAYVYDPRLAVDLERHIEYMLQALENRRTLDKLIEAVLNRQIRLTVGSLSALELMNGLKGARLEQKLCRTLARDLQPFGIRLDPAAGLTIEGITPPIKLSQAHQTGLAHFLEVVSGLRDLSDEERSQLFQVNLSKSGNLTYFMGNHMGNDGNGVNPPIILPAFPPKRSDRGRRIEG